jgi:hypothetical protein
LKDTYPNAVLIGVQKGGTTALYNWIAQHPEVYGDPAMKDFPYFCNGGYQDKDDEWFAERFSGWNGQRIILHGYVHYLYFAKETAERLKSFNPDLRLIAVLRNPAERAYSAYLQARKTGHEPIARFEEAIDYELSGNLLSFKDITNRSYIAQGKYSNNIRKYYEHFGPDRLKIVLHDELKNNPERICREIYNFLSIDSNFTVKISNLNEYGTPRSGLLRNLVNNGIKSPRIRELLPINMRIRARQIVRAFNTKRGEKPELGPDTWQRMNKFYEAEIDDLERILNINLDHWRNYYPQ